MQKSFTLIELMTVIGIIAILAGLMLVGYNIFFSEANIGSSMRFDSSIHHSLGYALVGDWKMDDNAANSTVVDTSGNGNDGTFYSGASEDNTANHSIDGANGRALEFDGVDDYIEVSNNNNLDVEQEITVSIWLKTLNNYEWQGLAAKGDFDQGWHILGDYDPDGNLLQAWINLSDSGWVSVEKEIPLQEWVYVVLTYDGSSLKLYVNGNDNENSGLSGTIEGEESYSLKIGNDVYGDNYFNGTIDQVRIYKNGLSLSKIKQQYYTGLQRLYKKGLISREEYIKRVVKR